jgi:ClpP class serine protease
VPEASDAIYAARQRKRVVAFTSDLMASAAYWLGSQASTLIAAESADIGSIGVFVAHTDCSGMMDDMGVKTTYIYAGEYKVEGNPTEPLSADSRAYYQREINATYVDFKTERSPYDGQ